MTAESRTDFWEREVRDCPEEQDSGGVKGFSLSTCETLKTEQGMKSLY